jgi:mono/diheme cytochrome c family protein
VSIVLAPVVVMLSLGLSAPITQAPTSVQEAPRQTSRTIWDGVYSADQAEKGRVVYETHCSRCHGAGLSGSANVSALAGEAFVRNWGGDTLGGLFKTIRTTMPRNFPSSLSDDEYLDVITYILKANELPAGPTPISIPELQQIQIVGKGGPEDVANFALVQVVGCMSERPDKSWALISGSKPRVMRDPDASKGDKLKNAEAQPLGDETFRLVLAYPTPSPSQVGQKFEAKGFLMRSPGNDGISITSLQPLSSDCR